jgi:hypothetical protein
MSTLVSVLEAMDQGGAIGAPATVAYSISGGFLYKLPVIEMKEVAIVLKYFSCCDVHTLHNKNKRIGHRGNGIL